MENIKSKILEILKKEADDSLSIEELGMDEKFSDFGIDSLDLSSIFLSIEDEFDVLISDDDIENLNTVNKIIEHLSNQ